MLVDDHPAFRKGLAALIESEPDLEVVAEAENGADALKLFRKEKPDVVLIDIGLPHIDGYEVARRLRACEPALGARWRLIAITRPTADGPL